MSASKFRVNKVCEHCSRPFEAQKVTTRYCGHDCSRAAHKLKARLGSIAEVEKATIQAAPKVQTPHHVLESLKHREFLNVQQVCKLLGCSKQTVYRLIHSGRLKAVNLACKKTTIKRAALDNLFV